MSTFFITGTGTGVGKTFVGAILLSIFLEDGFSVCPLKPVETGINGEGKSDIERLLEVASCNLPIDELSPYRFSLPASPHLAAKEEFKKIPIEKLEDIARKYETKFDYTLIEGCGGLMVPFSESGYFMADWIKSLKIPLILTASRELGTINHTLLSVELCKARKLPLVGIIFSDPTPPQNLLIAKDNVKIIEKFSGVPVIGTIPYCNDANSGKINTFIDRKLLYSVLR